MPMSVWFGVKFTPGGHSSFFGFLNTFVHIIMYSYYLLAALGPKYQKYLWWKKYLTTIQMVWTKCCCFIDIGSYFCFGSRFSLCWLWFMPSNCFSSIATIPKRSFGGLVCMQSCSTSCSLTSIKRRIRRRKLK